MVVQVTLTVGPLDVVDAGRWVRRLTFTMFLRVRVEQPPPIHVAGQMRIGRTLGTGNDGPLDGAARNDPCDHAPCKLSHGPSPDAGSLRASVRNRLRFFL